jgi:hypothetical protein
MQTNKHTVEVIHPDLEIDEHLPLQESGWVVQRFGWIFIVSVMVAGGLGLFGEGILSKRKVTAGSSKAEYEHYFRYETEMKMLVQSPKHIGSISLSQEYLKKFRIVRFVPEPVDNNTLNNEVRYNFLPAENHIVSIYMISKDYGSISGTMKVNETDKINLHHFIYP